MINEISLLDVRFIQTPGYRVTERVNRQYMPLTENVCFTLMGVTGIRRLMHYSETHSVSWNLVNFSPLHMFTSQCEGKKLNETFWWGPEAWIKYQASSVHTHTYTQHSIISQSSGNLHADRWLTGLIPISGVCWSGTFSMLVAKSCKPKQLMEINALDLS